jgi:pyruvate/2-oxoglutarate dehydrogenase complex dihydrolipoamide acyltransferase (E2) component
MNIQARKTALYCATLAGLLVLSACGKNEEASNTTPTAPTSSAPAPAVPAPANTAPTPASSTPSPASTAPAPAQTTGKSASVNGSGEIKVAAVTIGSQVDAAHAISKEQRQFAPEDKAIYASVATTGTTDNATLNAKWSYVDGQDETFTSTTESIATDGPAITTFKVQNPNAWPKGKYKVVISLNGKPVASENFQVVSSG